MLDRRILREARRLVIKVGTRVCIRPDGLLNGEVLVSLARQVHRLRGEGREVVMVSSGAVGMGRALMRGNSAEETLPTKQALAALGQVELVNAYKQLFGLLHIPVAQVLLTRDDLGARDRYRNTLRTLLAMGVLPVVNENDSVATQEIRFGDNDSLAAMVGALLDAPAVINLTSAPGILAPAPQNPGQDRVLDVVRRISPEIEALDRGTLSAGGTGGLASKLEAARIATRYGAAMVMAEAAAEDILLRLVAGEKVGTLFTPGSVRLRGRKRWLAMGARTRGTLHVDAGAARALLAQGRSLLPVGIARVEGRFKVGDLVGVCDPEGREIGRGLTNYASEDILRLKGLPTSRISEVLGHPGYPEIIHRDNLAASESP